MTDDKTTTESRPHIEPTYLGDGVYASFDGYHIVLDLRAQGPDRIALDPSVFRALQLFANNCWPKPLTDGPRPA